MRAILASWKDRLPSALGALAVQAALDAVNRRRGVIRKPVLASAKTGESGNEQDRVDGRGDGPELRPGTGAD